MMRDHRPDGHPFGQCLLVAQHDHPDAALHHQFGPVARGVARSPGLAAALPLPDRIAALEAIWGVGAGAQGSFGGRVEDLERMVTGAARAGGLGSRVAALEAASG